MHGACDNAWRTEHVICLETPCKSLGSVLDLAIGPGARGQSWFTEHGICHGAWDLPWSLGGAWVCHGHGIGHGASSLGSVMVHGNRNLGSALGPCSEWAMKQKP